MTAQRDQPAGAAPIPKESSATSIDSAIAGLQGALASSAPSSTLALVGPSTTETNPSQTIPISQATSAGSEDDSTSEITVIDRDIKKPAALIKERKEYQIDVAHDGTFFIGAVQLKKKDQAEVIFDLIDPAGCLKKDGEGREEVCRFFSPTELPRSKIPQKRQDFVASDGVDVSFLARPIPPLEPLQPYIIEIIWATQHDPMQEMFLRNSPMDSDGQPMFFYGALATAIDSGRNWPPSTAAPISTSAQPDEKTANISKTEATATPSSSSNNQNKSGDGGLSTSAKAGIAVGAVLCVLLLVALIFLFLRRRKSKRKTAGGFYGDAPGSSNELPEKEAGVGIAAIPVSASPTSDGDAGDASMRGRGTSRRVVDGANLENGAGPVTHSAIGHVTPAAAVARKPVGSRSVRDEDRVGREGAVSAQNHVLSDDERARWEEEERRLDEDIAEAERRRLAR